jgi:hypothetical protein
MHPIDASAVNSALTWQHTKPRANEAREAAMQTKYRNCSLVIIASALLASCGITNTEGQNDRYEIGNIPENVVAMAAPDQDLSTARLQSEDDCYWYMHAGPVETTLVPLRATGGRPICVVQQPVS